MREKDYGTGHLSKRERSRQNNVLLCIFRIGEDYENKTFG